MSSGVEWWQAALGLVLIALAIGISLAHRLGLERSILWASLRAAVQLVAVGLLFTWIFEADWSRFGAWIWVGIMVAIAAWVVTRRASAVPGRWWIGLSAIVATVGVVLAVIFGLGILEAEPVAIVVIAGITIGNTMPAVVQAVDRMKTQLLEQAGQLEAMLALGFDGPEASRPVVREVVRLALLPQIERTKVVGLIALPGAMTGLLLAGVDPIDAVLVQLVVMFLVLGSIATAVAIVTLALSRQAFTSDLRLAAWTTSARDGSAR